MNGRYYVPNAVLNTPARIWHCKYIRENGVQKALYEPDEDIMRLWEKFGRLWSVVYMEKMI